MSNLKEARAKLDAKRDQMRLITAQMRPDGAEESVVDVQGVTGLGDEIDKLKGAEKSLRIAAWIRDTDAEINDLADEVKTFEAAEKALDDFVEGEKTIKRPTHPNGQKEPPKSFGEMVTSHPKFKDWIESGGQQKMTLDIGLAELKAQEKALFITTSGWPPESTRTGQFVDAVTRPIQVTDIMPRGNTGQALVVYMREDTRTHAAAEVAEGDAVAESTFITSQQTSTVQMIGDSVPVTEIQLEDVPQVQSYLDGRLNFGVQQRLDGQIISGDGIAPNLEGILNVAGIQTQAKGLDPVIDAYFKAMTLCRITGRAPATHCLFHPNDWEPIRLLRTADGIYIWGNPSEAGPMRLWGLPVVESESLTENTGLVGSFNAAWIQLVERRGIVVEMGLVDTQFTEFEKTIRASGRWALPVFRPAAFCTVTGI